MDDYGTVIRTDNHAIRAELAQLRQEHRDLDAAIDALHIQAHLDSLQLQRLKKKKLVLKDRIIELQDRLLPDITA
ncbi:hypothetical protein SAMN05216548_10139 [Faunimonas pinastri]|uniref:DUF465 domain-containing protein n=1 Tax=Faunimonas pinastri TaxID=1855383 RepID=A0A1H8Z730_9HYPH|nr:DUF465 domain-containing protein [Faunimonas pinastri]SEP59418.1 hypothetical protein SAMN05216548_10139 [Faunimonas pinastri]